MNALPSKADQIQFLTGLLPPKDAAEKKFTQRQDDAVTLLGLTGAPEVIPAIIDRLEFQSQGTVNLALGHLGEPAVEPLVRELERGSHRRHNLAINASADDQRQTIWVLRLRDYQAQDLKLSDETVEMILLLSEINVKD